ncbi:MAG: cupin domain-containing protein [Chitinophagaceae bacterium]|nr:cupin domain-containing protein [Chitinophagaceae bacterium]
MADHKLPEGSIFLPANQGRHYNMGKMQAIFKADEEETKQQYCISEWWLDPYSEGPGAHSHEKNQDIFYVLEGTVSILVGKEWLMAAKGSFILIPENTIHDFANRTDSKIGLLNFFIPGGFERNMPSIVKWFEEKNTK